MSIAQETPKVLLPVPQPDTTKTSAAPAADSLGHYVEINRIFVTGNRITRDNIISRELALKPGTVIYNQDIDELLQKDEKKLLNTRLFNTVDIRHLELEPGRVDLIVDVDERWYTFPIPIFELSDRNFNEWWQNYHHNINRVNYGLRLYQSNMRGRNETLRLTAQFGYSKHLSVAYRMPYIDREQRHGLTFEFHYLENKNLAFRTVQHKLDYLEADQLLRIAGTAAVTYTYRNSFFDYHNIGVEYHDTEVGDTIQALNPDYLGEGVARIRYASLFYEFITDHRDAVSYPLRGYYLYLHAQQYGFGNEAVNKTEAFAGLSKFADLHKSYYLSNFSFLYWSRQNETPYLFYSALGYMRIFPRGFERYVIEGPRFALNKLTVKKLLFSRVYHWTAWPVRQFRHIPLAIYLKAYGDLAYVENYPNCDVNGRFSDQLIGGTGMGIDIVGSYDMVFRIEYSINSAGEHGLFLHVKKEF